MTMDLAQLQKTLRHLEDPETALFLQSFFKTGPGEYGDGDVFRGIRVPLLRKLAKEYQHLTLAETKRLLHSAYHEDRLLALFILARAYLSGDNRLRERIFNLYINNTQFINNWDLVDTSAPQIVGFYLWDKDRNVLYRLARSRHIWERRISIMATFNFLKRDEYTDTLKIAALLLSDSEDLIHKAVGWMLREVGNRNREVEEKFLRKHYERMPRVMLRYAIEKFPEPRRQQYLKG
ncbi:MAG TPA: DNA alkylation repair protein, partial [Blastocatellia bacterium]|nr:DNA alkylation repair protein [Blastocatellia bacterium]